MRDISLTANCCTLRPHGKNVELPDYIGGIHSQSTTNCNVELCWKIIWHLLYGESEPEKTDTKHENESTNSSIPAAAPANSPFVHPTQKSIVASPLLAENTLSKIMSEICFATPNAKNGSDNVLAMLPSESSTWKMGISLRV